MGFLIAALVMMMVAATIAVAAVALSSRISRVTEHEEISRGLEAVIENPLRVS